MVSAWENSVDRESGKGGWKNFPNKVGNPCKSYPQMVLLMQPGEYHCCQEYNCRLVALSWYIQRCHCVIHTYVDVFYPLESGDWRYHVYVRSYHLCGPAEKN